MVKLKLGRPGTTVRFGEREFSDKTPVYDIPDAEAESLKTSVFYGYLEIVGPVPATWTELVPKAQIPPPPRKVPVSPPSPDGERDEKLEGTGKKGAGKGGK